MSAKSPDKRKEEEREDDIVAEEEVSPGKQFQQAMGSDAVRTPPAQRGRPVVAAEGTHATAAEQPAEQPPRSSHDTTDKHDEEEEPRSIYWKSQE